MAPKPLPGQRGQLRTTPTTPDESSQHAARLLTAMVPPDIVERISKEALTARVAYAADLSRLAAKATDPAVALGYKTLGEYVLKALPQSEVEQRHRMLTEKANGMAPGSAERKRLLQQAQELADLNPQPPALQARNAGPVSAGGTRAMGGRQPVAKAGAAASPSMVAVYDAHGCLIGVAPADKITPLEGNGAGCKQPDGVAKAATAGPKSRPPGSRGRR
jgi:hypothetical protein